MDRIAVKSSTIRSIGYDNDRMVLEIEFLKGGLYQYQAVPDAIYRALMAASSKGKYFDKHIRNEFRTTKVH